MYTKQFQTETNATNYRTKHRRNKTFCGMQDHVSKNIDQTQTPSDIDLTLEHFKLSSEGISPTVFAHKLTFQEGKNDISYNWDGNVNEIFVFKCQGYE